MKSYQTISAKIAILRTTCYPVAVFNRISFIVIFSVNRMILGWMPHIVKEVFKLVPTLTDLNSTFSVMVVRWIFNVTTSLNHCAPDIINGSPGQPVGFGSSSHVTTTRNYFPRLKMVEAYCFFCSTVATTQKILFPVFVGMRKRYYQKFSITGLDHALI